MTGVPASAAGGPTGARGAASGRTGADGTSGAAAGGGDRGAQEPAVGRPARGGKIAAAAVNQASVWNVANLLTMLRLLLVPAFVLLMLADGGTTRHGGRSPGRPSPSP